MQRIFNTNWGHLHIKLSEVLLRKFLCSYSSYAALMSVRWFWDASNSTKRHQLVRMLTKVITGSAIPKSKALRQKFSAMAVRILLKDPFNLWLYKSLPAKIGDMRILQFKEPLTWFSQYVSFPHFNFLGSQAILTSFRSIC